MLEIKRYTPAEAGAWNRFVAESKNGTFLFDRLYMDYHSDRFQDHSLMFYRDERLYALLPANECGQVLYTHQGLTYGGLVMGVEATTAHVIEIFQCIKSYMLAHGFRRMVYKAKPWIYHLVPAEEPLYAIHLTFNYRLLERDVSSAIVMARQLKWKKDRRHGLRVALDHQIDVKPTADYPAFWQILTQNLSTNHGVAPVHTLDEILLLHSRFPDGIVLYGAYRNDAMLGGCVAYVTRQVVHTQYIAATPEGKRLGVVNAVVAALLADYPDYMYFDFGKSTEAHSNILNTSLLYQKEGFGARAVCYDTYELTL